MKRYPWAALSIGFGAAAIAYLSFSHGPDSGRAPWIDGGDPALPVTLAAAEKAAVSYVLHAGGRLLPVSETAVVAPVAGRVERIAVAVGDNVSAGQAVATLDQTEQRRRVAEDEAAVEAAEAGLRERESRLAAAQKQAENARAFRLKDFISAQELAAAETQARAAGVAHDLARAELAQRRATLAQSRYLLTLAVIVAPFDGVVARRLVEAGAAVPAATPILTLAPPDPLKIEVIVPELDAGLLRAGMAARLDVESFPGRTFEGKVARLVSLPDGSGALAAEVHARNPERLLKSGMAARVSVALGGKSDAILVPSAAVIEEEEGGAAKKFVFTVANGKAKKIAVTAGRIENGRTEIVHGLAAGEKVVVAGGERLRSEMRVRVVEEKARSGK